MTLRTGCLGSALIAFLGYGVLVSTPVERHTKVVEGALTDVGQRLQQRKIELKDPQMNGYLSPGLESLWGGGEEEARGLVEILNAWVLPYSYQSSGVTVDHAGLLASKDVAYMKARKDFEALLPELVEALSKPLLQPVNEELFQPSRVFNEEALRTLTLALNAYAESLLMEGQPGKSALVYELAFRQGALVADDVATIPTSLGMSLQGLAFQSMVGYFQPAVELSVAQWAGLSRALVSMTPTATTLQESMQNDLAFGVNFLQQPRSSYDGDAKPLRGIYLLPGMRAHDQRVYRNVMGRALLEAAEGRVVESLPPSGAAAMVKGDNGAGTALLVPDYRRQSARLLLHAGKMKGLAAMAAVCAYRAAHGALPQALTDLDQLNLHGPGELSWSKVEGVTYEAQEGKAILRVAIDPAFYQAAGVDVESAEQMEAANSVYFRLHKDGFSFAL